MWHDIVKTNKTAILTELRAYGAHLNELIGAIDRQDFEAVRTFLERARKLRMTMVE